MILSPEEQDMLGGKSGKAVKKAMEILVALGVIYGAKRMAPVTSVQIAGVSFDNLGEAGLEFLTSMAEGGGRARVLTTLNPAGMDIENWQALGISDEFAQNQLRVVEAFAKMGVVTTCTCTPYLSGNLPLYGAHIAWSESSAVCFANSVLGARTNREGGPSALAASLTGRTPEYGFHLDSERKPALTVFVDTPMESGWCRWVQRVHSQVNNLDASFTFGALGKAIGQKLEERQIRPVVYIRGIKVASLENLKSFCASLATFGGVALFHLEGITPEASCQKPPKERIEITSRDLDEAIDSLNDAKSEEVDFISLGCPHLSLREIARAAELLQGKKVKKEFWITTARSTMRLADQIGYSQVIAASGVKLAVDTCCVVAPIKGRFKALATDSAKACYYASAKNRFKTKFIPFDEVIQEALR